MISGLLLQFASIIAALLKGLVSLKLLSGHGTEFYGTYSQFSTVTTLFGAILSLQLDSATVRFAVGSNPRPLGGVICTNLLCILTVGGVLLAICLFGGNTLSTWVYDRQGLNFPVLLSAISSIMTAMQLVMLSGLQATTRFKSMTLLQTGQLTLQVLAIAIALHCPQITFIPGFSVATHDRLITTVMTALVVVDALTLTGGVWLLRHDLRQARPDWAYLRQALTFVAPLCGAFLLTWAIHSGGRFLLVQRWGLGAVGVYSATFTIASLAGSFTAPFVKVIYPVITATPDHTAQGILLRLWLRRYAICANYMFIILVGLGHLLLKSVSSGDFFAGPWVMAGLAFGFICTGFTRLLSILLQAHDKTNTMMSTLAAGVICGLGIAAFGVGRWKAEALALGYAVGFGLPLLLMWPAIPKAGLLPRRNSVIKFIGGGIVTNAFTVLPLVFFHANTLWQGIPIGLACTLIFGFFTFKSNFLARADVSKLAEWARQRLGLRAKNA